MCGAEKLNVGERVVHLLNQVGYNLRHIKSGTATILMKSYSKHNLGCTFHLTIQGREVGTVGKRDVKRGVVAVR